MICSDGIMDGLWEDTIRKMLTEQKSVPEIMQNLSRKAIENDDKDDTTLIVAEISRI
jgi:serine/threonine protein phosphatase PrpC